MVCADLFPSSENNRTGFTGAGAVCDLCVHGLELLHGGFKAVKGEDKCIVKFIVVAVLQVRNETQSETKSSSLRAVPSSESAPLYPYLQY